MNKEPCVYLHPLLAKEKGIQDDTMVKVFNEKGKWSFAPNILMMFNQQTIFIYPNHPIINKLITFTPADMGELVTGGKGNALNSL